MMPISSFSATSHVLAYSDSWEEKAFAEDSAAHLGGCIWPPRSYSCSFCGREFRSAQALGGHMNVHRRERARARARLEESTNQRQKPSPPVLRQYPSQVCTLVYNSNPNFVDATLPPPGVLLPSTQDDCAEQSFPFISSIIQEQPKGSSQSLGSSNSNIERENFGVGEMGYCCVPREVPKPNFALSSSDSFTHGSRMLDSGGEEEEAISSKRQKKGSSSPLLIQRERGGTFTLFPFFMTSGLGERRIRSSGVLGLGADSNEDLDLELRLGDRPKVK